MADALDLPKLPSPADYNDIDQVPGTEAPAENKESIFVGILETLQQNNFLLMNLSESTDIIEENTEDDESQTERRNRRINEENTDKPGAFSRAIGGLGAGVKGVGGILNKANPFQEGGLGTKMSILLISGVLFAISKFGDKLVKPLAEVLEMFDSEGGVLEKLKNTELFKGVVATFEKIGADISERFETFSTDIKAKFETIGTDIETAFADAKTTFETMGDTIKTMGDDVEKLMESVTLVSGYIKEVYDMINDYIMQFDTRGTRTMHPTEGVIETGDGKLDAFEMKNLKEDAQKKVFGFIESLVDNIMKGLYTFLGASVVLSFIKGLAYRFGKGNEGPNKRSSRKDRTPPGKSSTMSTILKRVAALSVSGSVGATAQAASLKPGQRLNKVGSIIDEKGRIVKTAKNVSHLNKYPRLMKVLKVPLLGPVISGLEVRNTLQNDELSEEEKKVAIGGHIFAGLGAAGFGAMGASLGLTFGPPGAIIGGIVGSLAGYGLGDMAGQALAGWLLGEKRAPIPLQSSGTLGEMSATLSDGQPVENLPTQIMSASTGEYPQSSFVSQLDGNLMNRNTDLALAAYEADKAANLKINTNPLPGGRGDMPLSMPVVVDKGQVTNIQSNYGSRLNVDNGNSTSRLFGDSLLIDIRGSLAGGF